MSLVVWWAGLTMEEVFLVTWGSVIGVPVIVSAIAIAIVVRKQKKGGEADERNTE